MKSIRNTFYLFYELWDADCVLGSSIRGSKCYYVLHFTIIIYKKKHSEQDVKYLQKHGKIIR